MPNDTTSRKRIHIYGDGYLPYFISHINNRLTSGASQLYRKRFGIGLNEFRILSVLANTPGSTATHICEVLGTHKAVVSRSLQEMAAKKLVHIDTTHKERKLTLTSEGDRMHDDIVLLALGRDQRLTHGFSKDERRQLLDMLQRLLANMPAVNDWDPYEDGAAQDTDTA